MKPVWCDKTVSDLRLVIQEKRKETSILQTCVENMAQSEEILQRSFMQPLKQRTRSTVRVKGNIYLAQQTRIHRLEKLVGILKQMIAILENFIAWANGLSLSQDMITSMSTRVNKEVLALYTYWIKEDDDIIDVTNDSIVENHIVSLHNKVHHILNSMKQNAEELTHSGIVVHIVNNYSNGEAIFSHAKSKSGDCFTNTTLGFCGQNMFKTEKVDVDYYNYSTGTQLINPAVIDALIHQMPSQYIISSH